MSVLVTEINIAMGFEFFSIELRARPCKGAVVYLVMIRF